MAAGTAAGDDSPDIDGPPLDCDVIDDNTPGAF
jgi:hypothetical protein